MNTVILMEVERIGEDVRIMTSRLEVELAAEIRRLAAALETGDESKP